MPTDASFMNSAFWIASNNLNNYVNSTRGLKELRFCIWSCPLLQNRWEEAYDFDKGLHILGVEKLKA